VLTSKLIYPAMAVDFPQWAYKTVDKIRRGYLWRGRREAKAGHYLVAWSVVCRPLQLGDLGISNLTILNWVLRVRWLWLQKIEPHRPWSSLPLQVPDQGQTLFSMSVTTQVGNGEGTLFWIDRWLQGKSILELGPHLFYGIPKRRRKIRTIREALNNNMWVSDFWSPLNRSVTRVFATLGYPTRHQLTIRYRGHSCLTLHR
jgi:hypothetical protein